MVEDYYHASRVFSPAQEEFLDKDSSGRNSEEMLGTGLKERMSLNSCEILWRLPVGGDVILLNMSDTDLELLSRYTRHHAEDAFAEIVWRYLDLVHSAALRQVRVQAPFGRNVSGSPTS